MGPYYDSINEAVIPGGKNAAPAASPGPLAAISALFGVLLG
jgi:hypothetical protein